MAAAYDKIKQKNGQIRFRKDKQNVKEADVPKNVVEALTLTNIVDENGLVIVEDKGNFGDDADTSDTNNQNGSEDQSNDNDSDTPGDGDDGSDEDSEPTTTTPAPEIATSHSDTPATADTVEAPVLNPSLPEQAAQDLANTPTRAFKSKTPQSKPGFGWPRKGGKTVDIFDGETPHTHVRSVGGYIVPLSAESYRTKTDAQIESRLRELGYELMDINDYADTAAENTNDTADEELSDDDLSDDN